MNNRRSDWLSHWHLHSKFQKKFEEDTVGMQLTEIDIKPDMFQLKEL